MYTLNNSDNVLSYAQFFKDCANSFNFVETKSNLLLIESTVGSGKSSLCKILQEELGWKVYDEPVIENPFLSRFYSDQNRWAFTLQTFFLNERFKMCKDAMSCSNAIMDRSIYGDTIFVNMLYKDGKLNTDEFELYRNMLKGFLSQLQKPTLLIYLKTDVERAINNIRHRGRDYEQGVDRSYWENLLKEYNDYFESYSFSEKLEIDVSGIDFVHNLEHRKRVVDAIKDKLKSMNII